VRIAETHSTFGTFARARQELESLQINDGARGQPYETTSTLSRPSLPPGRSLRLSRGRAVEVALGSSRSRFLPGEEPFRILLDPVSFFLTGITIADP
jgi:hypothetical protein